MDLCKKLILGLRWQVQFLFEKPVETQGGEHVSLFGPVFVIDKSPGRRKVVFRDVIIEALKKVDCLVFRRNQRTRPVFQ